MYPAEPQEHPSSVWHVPCHRTSPFNLDTRWSCPATPPGWFTTFGRRMGDASRPGISTSPRGFWTRFNIFLQSWIWLVLSFIAEVPNVVLLALDLNRQPLRQFIL